VIQPRILNEISQAAAVASFWIASSKDQTLDTTVDQRSGTHGARFEGHIEITADKSPTPHGLRSLSNGQNLGVGQWIGIALAAIKSPPNDLPGTYDDGAYRHLSQRSCLVSFRQRFLHPVGVIHGVVGFVTHGTRRPDLACEAPFLVSFGARSVC